MSPSKVKERVTEQCDYTGWDCQAGNGGSVASSEEDIVRFGMGDVDRERFGLQSKESR